MIHGLNTWWNDALAAPFLTFHAEPRSWAIGFFAGLLVALIVMAWSLRRFARLPARQLLAGNCESVAAAKAAAAWQARMASMHPWNAKHWSKLRQLRLASGDLDRDAGGFIWAQDGSGLYFSTENHGTSNLYFLPLLLQLPLLQFVTGPC